MAISGDGTQERPFIAYTYEDLRGLAAAIPNYSTAYAELGANIDCNDYGEGFEWETVQLGRTGTPSVPYGYLIFNLGGHTIKNIAVKKDNSLFNSDYSNNLGKSLFTGNGELLNVFTQPNSTAYLITCCGIDNTISMLSFSANIGNESCGIFRNTMLNRVSCYAQGYSFTQTSGANALILSFDSSHDYATTTARMSNCDLEIHFTILDSPLYTAYNLREQLIAIDSRLQGSMGGAANGYVFACGYLSNCVVDVDASAHTGINIAIARYNSTGAINTELRPSGTAENTWRSNMTAYLSAEMLIGADLRSKGFTVVNVVGG